MSAKSIFQRLVERAMMSIRTSGSLRRKSGKPGEMIQNLSDEERSELKNLSSEDAQDITHDHRNYMIGAYPESTITVHTHSIKK